MTANKCGTCARTMGDDATICTTCMDVLLRGLGDVPALAEDLDLTLRKRLPSGGLVNLDPKSDKLPGDRPELGVQIQGHPYNRVMSDALGQIRNTLTTWVRDFIDHHPEPYPADTLAAMSRWLMLRSERIRRHPAAAEISDEILHAVALCWAAVDLAPEGSTFQVGPCPEKDQDGAPCPGEIRAFIPASMDVEARMTCTREPEHTYAPSQWRRAGSRINHERERRTG